MIPFKIKMHFILRFVKGRMVNSLSSNAIRRPYFMEDNRTRNTTKITISKNLKQLVELITGFVTRTVFIHCLGADYLGLNGLFTSILSTLSLAELGVGSAIVFQMYKPISEKNYDVIKKLVAFYKKCYNIIGIGIFVIGVCLIPLLPVLVNLDNSIPVNYYIIYLLYLFNTASSYWYYSYLQSVMIAYQKQDIVYNYNSWFKIIFSILGSIGLVVTRNYYVYLCLNVIVTLVQNLFIRNRVYKLFPFIRDINGFILEKEKVKKIYKDMSAIMIDRVSNTLSSSFDTMIVSAFVSTTLVGCISNYAMINNMVIGIGTSLSVSAYGGIGNLVAKGNKAHDLEVFYRLDFINSYLLYFIVVCVCTLSTPFIILWAGTNYIIDYSIVFCIAFDAYIYNSLWPIWGFKDGMGLFSKGKFLKLIRGISNVILSVVICRYYGAFGVYFASLITNAIITVPMFIYITFKYGFECSPVYYYLTFAFRTVITIFAILMTRRLCSLFGDVTWFTFIGMFFTCIIVPNVIYFLIFGRSKEWKEVKDIYILPLLNKVISKMKKF